MILLIIIFGIGLIPILLTWTISKHIQKKEVRFFIRAVVITTVHFLISVLLNSIGFIDSLCLAHDDSDIEGSCPPPSGNLQILIIVGKILYFPISYFPIFLFSSLFQGLEIILLILNSCLWGFGIVFFIKTMSPRKQA